MPKSWSYVLCLRYSSSMIFKKMGHLSQRHLKPPNFPLKNTYIIEISHIIEISISISNVFQYQCNIGISHPLAPPPTKKNNQSTSTLSPWTLSTTTLPWVLQLPEWYGSKLSWPSTTVAPSSALAPRLPSWNNRNATAGSDAWTATADRSSAAELPGRKAQQQLGVWLFY